MSPAKTGLLKWLFSLQDKAIVEGVSAWFWLDLFCIDQSWEDESLFGMQLQQIPEVFGNAVGCVALIASWPCHQAENLVLSPRASSDDEPDEHWKQLRSWVKEHHQVCNCTPLVDAWMTRVWTRQELLYSKAIILCSAIDWLHGEKHSLCDDLWTSKSALYSDIRPQDGLDELASCLTTWAARHNRTYSSDELAAIATNLIKGISVPQSISDLPRSRAPDTPVGEWFAFNWAMILNGSIRKTTKARDAILSQMLLLPGYVAPPLPRLMSLQDIAGDASAQFRRLVKAYRLVPLDLRFWHAGEERLYRAMRHRTTQPTLSEVLEAVGSPCKLSRFHGSLTTTTLSPLLESNSSLLAYKPDGNPAYEVIQELDLVHDPLAAIDFFIQLKLFWDTLGGCAIETRVWTRLKAMYTTYATSQPRVEQAPMLSQSLQEIVWYLLAGRDPLSTLKEEETTEDPSSSPLNTILPPLRAVRITYDNAPAHVNLLFGDLPIGSTGPLLGLGVDKGHNCEVGVVGELEDDNQIVLRSFGAIMVMTNRKILDAEARTEFYSVKGTRNYGKESVSQ